MNEKGKKEEMIVSGLLAVNASVNNGSSHVDMADQYPHSTSDTPRQKTGLEKFNEWLKKPLKMLYEANAGYPILMITLPLLERFLRAKSKSLDSQQFNNEAHEEMAKIFPALKDSSGSRAFWPAYRNGLLHQAFPNVKTKADPYLTFGLEMAIKYRPKEKIIVVNPIIFSKKVIEVIESNFSFFEAVSNSHPIPDVHSLVIKDATV
jgi:hypothetical protein